MSAAKHLNMPSSRKRLLIRKRRWALSLLPRLVWLWSAILAIWKSLTSTFFASRQASASVPHRPQRSRWRRRRTVVSGTKDFSGTPTATVRPVMTFRTLLYRPWLWPTITSQRWLKRERSDSLLGTWAGGLSLSWNSLRDYIFQRHASASEPEQARPLYCSDYLSRTWPEWFWLSQASLGDYILRQPASEPERPDLRECTCSTNGRNLVVCIDGTSNQFSVKNTNVVELYSRLIKDEDQLTFYNSGIGTYATPSWRSFKYYMQVLVNKLDLAFALNFERILLSAYLWLSENYRPGDRIFLFGFSRGAYQVRGLAAMIEQVGLIHKGNQDQIPFAYQLYAETKKVKDAANMRAHFKRTFSHMDVCIHYAGLWDTVSSVGIIRDKTLPGTTDGLRFICFVRHALALNDRRVKFLPEYVHGGDGPLEDEVDESDMDPPHTKEVWFAGSHGDVGGGSVENSRLNQFGPALRWISFEAVVAGLRLSDAPQDWNNEAPKVHDSMGYNIVWNLLEILPITHLTYTDSTTTRSLPHFRQSRSIRPRQLIHETALPETTLPTATLPSDILWDDLHIKDDMIELDPYTQAQSVLARLENFSEIGFPIARPADLLAFNQLVSTDPGWRSLRDSSNAISILTGVLGRMNYFDIPNGHFDLIYELEMNAADYARSTSGVQGREMVSPKST